MNDELNTIEDQALDALLFETLGGAKPPDLTDKILASWHTAPADEFRNAPTVLASDAVRTASRAVSTKSNLAMMVAVIAGLAAALLIAFTLRDSSSTVPPSNDAIAHNRIDPVVSPAVEPVLPKLADHAPESTRPPVAPRRGIPLVIGGSSDQPPTSPQQDNVANSRSDQPVELTLVSRQVVEEVNQYWQAVGIQPTDEATADEVVKRLAMGLGVELSSAAINDPEQLQAELSQPQVAQAVARNWLQQVSEGGIASVKKESSELLNQELADSFRSKQGFDRVLVNLINGNSPNSSAFLAAVSGGKQDEQAIVRRLAALTMNVDLRCTQCHDSYIDKSDRQEDFWAFAALIGRGMQRDGNGNWAVNESPSDQSFFYQLPDHRQKFVEPSVAQAWCKSDRPITTIDQWTEHLVGSPELALGVINSLWQVVHGRPLSGRVVDPISAPHNESLDRLEDRLVQDLIRSDFDVARSLSLIIASPTTRRSVPTVLQPENALVASEVERRAAMNQVDAFAAATPIAKPLSSIERLAQVKRAIGLTLDPNGESFVGQFGETVDGAMQHQSTTKTLSAELPDRAEQFPVQWLGAIKNEKSQIEHLGYLAGMSKVPDSVLTADEEMRKADVSEALRLHRVWWLIQP